MSFDPTGKYDLSEAEATHKAYIATQPETVDASCCEFLAAIQIALQNGGWKLTTTDDLQRFTAQLGKLDVSVVCTGMVLSVGPLGSEQPVEGLRYIERELRFVADGRAAVAVVIEAMLRQDAVWAVSEDARITAEKQEAAQALAAMKVGS